MVTRKGIGKNITNYQNVTLLSFFLKTQTIGIQELTCKIREAELLRSLNNDSSISDSTWKMWGKW